MGTRKNPNDNTVSAEQVHDLAGGILQRCLQWTDTDNAGGHRRCKCTVRNIVLILFFAAARASSIFDACRRLRGNGNAPSDQAVRNALVEMLPATMSELEQRLNSGLRQKLPKSLFRKARPIAIDITQVGYYGQPHQHERELCRGKRVNGTSRFHSYATLCVLRRGERFTIALTYVWKDDTHADVARRLLEQARRRLGLRVRWLLLDRGFYGLDVVQYLQSIRCPFLMPVVHRGRRPKRKALHELAGTRRFLAWKRSGFATQVMRNRQRAATVNICVVCLPPTKSNKKTPRRSGRRSGRSRRRQPLVFAFWGFRPARRPGLVRHVYRTRYGIESSYRQMNQGRIRTCCRDPRVRLLLAGIALILRNVWVWLHRMVFARACGAAGIRLRLELLRLRTMLLMLQRCAEQWLGCTEATQDLTGPELHAMSPS